jgi:GNAT superfamily N-acetyltransferase
MEQLNLTVKLSSKSRVIASSGPFQIELMNQVGLEDHPQLIEISHHLAGEYGEAAVLTKETINKYFNKQGSLPFIARYRGDIIGYIIGVPLEELDTEPWARMDENFSKNNTLYTYAFVIMNKYKGNGYAKILKRVYLSWAKKRDDIRYITGHVKESISAKFTGDIKIISRVENWQGTGKTFEYYQRDLGPKPENKYKNNPPLVENV